MPEVTGWLLNAGPPVRHGGAALTHASAICQLSPHLPCLTEQSLGTSARCVYQEPFGIPGTLSRVPSVPFKGILTEEGLGAPFVLISAPPHPLC